MEDTGAQFKMPLPPPPLMPYSRDYQDDYIDGPLMDKLKSDLTFKPSEKKHLHTHYDYFSYLVKIGRIKKEQGIVKFSAPASVLDRMKRLNYDELFETKVNVSLQNIYHVDDESGGLVVDIAGVKRDTVKQLLEWPIARRRQIRHIELIKHRMSNYWDDLKKSSAITPFSACCSAYLRDESMKFERIVNTTLQREFLKAIEPREGVHTNYVYVGTDGAISGRHNDDFDMLSVNVMYFGMPKVWYVIPEGEFMKFDAAVKRIFGGKSGMDATRQMSTSFLLSPQGLEAEGINYVVVSQSPGDIIYTFGKTVYFAVNTGPSLEQWSSCGHYMWAQCATGESINYNVISGGVPYSDHEQVLLKFLMRKKEKLWENNRIKRLHIKSRPDYLERRHHYDRIAKKKKTKEQIEEAIRRKKLNKLARNLRDGDANPLRSATAMFTDAELEEELARLDDGGASMTSSGRRARDRLNAFIKERREEQRARGEAQENEDEEEEMDDDESTLFDGQSIGGDRRRNIRAFGGRADDDENMSIRSSNFAEEDF